MVGYRKKVVFQNLSNSFPNKSSSELNQIIKEFYAHFCDVVVESIHLFSMSEDEAIKRCKCRNPEILEPYFKANQSIVLGSGHYNNWELVGVAFALQVKHLTLCPYTPLSSTFLNGKMQESREKYGARLVEKPEVRKTIELKRERPFVLVFGTDQNPSSRSKKLFWTRFLNQDTAVNFGMEKYAVDYDLPVFFMNIYKIKRGYYEYEFELITGQPKETNYGFITEKHTQILEQQIIDKPQFWLWTHKRWKRKKSMNNE